MRTTINHTTPTTMLPVPESDGSAHVLGQFAEWIRTGTPIHTQSAMAIAAWYQSPGTHGIGMAQFASTGTITDDLLDDVRRELVSRDAETMNELLALRAYVDACTVTGWTVGNNVAGYVPESDVMPFLSYADAVARYEEMLREAPEDWYADEPCECDADGGELCDMHSMEALVGAFIADEITHGPSEPRDLLMYLRPEFLPLPTAFWLTRTDGLRVSYYRLSQDA